jgi:quercetin dioxygenase-like cupin family protein
MKVQGSHVRTVVRQHDEAERRWFFGGGLHLWKVTNADTGGAFSVFEDVLTKGKMTPLHQHDHSDELVYVIDGEILLVIDGEEQAVKAGGIALVSRGTPHALLVTSETCRLLVFATSSRTEAFFRAASEAAASPDATGPVDFERVIAAAVETGGMKMLGPPPFKR